MPGPVPALPPWLEVAIRERGVHETPGPGTTSRIVEYDSATSLGAKSDEVPWCAAFVGWCLREVGIEGTGSARARSYLQWGRPLTEPQVGAVCVLERGDPALGQGHVFFWMDEHHGLVYGWGGNQGDRVGLMGFTAERVLGYRWPVL